MDYLHSQSEGHILLLSNSVYESFYYQIWMWIIIESSYFWEEILSTVISSIS